MIPAPNFIIIRDDQDKPHSYEVGVLILGELQAYKTKHKRVQPIPSVLGTSFLRDLKAKVYLDYDKFEGYIETTHEGGM